MLFDGSKQKQSQYQNAMKSYYDELNQRAVESIRKDREFKDYMNDWKYCNPENIDDELPMPYKAINDILQEDILNTVWIKAREIDKYRLDPSYDGMITVIFSNIPIFFEASLTKLYPSGEVTSISTISVIAEAPGNPSKHLFIGDFQGNLIIFDQTKKQVVQKFDQLPKGKRVVHISASSIKLLETSVITLVVIQRASNKVHILRYLQGENQLSIVYTITVSPQPPTETSRSALNYPFSSQISLNSTYLSLSLYSGNVQIFKIPEPPLQKYSVTVDPENVSLKGSEDSQRGGLSISYKPGEIQNTLKVEQSKQATDPKPQIKSPQIIDLQPFYSIEFKGKKRDKKHDEIMKEIQGQNDQLRSNLLGITLQEWNLMNNPQLQLQMQQEALATAAAPQKKEAKKAGKQDEKKEVPVEQPPENVVPDFLLNKEVLFKEDKIDPQWGDITEDINLPFYKPVVYFLTDTVTFTNKEKTFNKPMTWKIVSGIVVTWLNQKNFQYYKLNDLNFGDVPTFYQYIALKNEEFKKPESEFTPFLQKSFSLIYPITCMQINQSEKYIGFGLKDGNVLLWDNEFKVEKKNLCAHSNSITCIKFFHEKFAVSGCMNGEIVIQSIQNDNSTHRIFNTFQVQKQNPILAIEVNKYGLVQVLDALGNSRTYNIHLGDKIAQVLPSLSFEKQRRSSDTPDVSQFNVSWLTKPKVIFHLSMEADQLYLLNQEISEKDQEVQSYGKRTVLQIFKLADNLTSVYEGIKSLKRNGADNDKILFQFTQMTIEQLNNKDFNFTGPGILIQEPAPQGTKNRGSLKPGDTYRSQDSRRAPGSNNSQTLSNENDSVIVKKQIEKKGIPSTADKHKRIPLPNLKTKQKMSQTKNEVSFLKQDSPLRSSRSSKSTKRSFFAPATSILKGLTEQRLHPEKYLWKTQYQNTEIFDPTSQTLGQAREKISQMHLLENNLAKQMIQIEKRLKLEDEERMQRLEAERRRQADEALVQKNEQKRKLKG